MDNIIDFRLKKGDLLRRKAEKCADLSRHHAARFEWLKRNGASLADQVRASLDANRAHGDCRQIEQTLSLLQHDEPLCS